MAATSTPSFPENWPPAKVPAALAPKSQAEIVIDKFGGAAKLAAAIGRNASSVYRWSYSAADGGTDGIIPARALRDVLKAAARLDILITPADLYPTK